jgi:hypothetical protein
MRLTTKPLALLCVLAGGGLLGSAAGAVASMDAGLAATVQEQPQGRDCPAHEERLQGRGV